MNAYLGNPPLLNLMLLSKANHTLAPLNETFNINKSTNSFCASPLERYEGLKYTVFVYYILVMVLAILGNTLIIYIVFYNKSIRTSTNIFIANMAVCDLGIPFFLLPKLIAELFIGRYVWLIPGETGLALCKIVPFIHDVFIDCSTFSLLLITFDRFCAVLLPHKRHLLSNKVVIILISSTWIASISINAVFFKIFKTFYKKEARLYCAPVWYSRSAFDAYIRTLICTNIIAPIILITAAYLAIFHKLKKQVLILGDAISDQLRQREHVRQKRIVKMTFAIVCTFGVWWLPVIFTTLLSPFLSLTTSIIKYPCWVYRVSEAAENIKVLSSVTNPVLCFIFGTKYREELIRIIRQIFACCCKKRRITNRNSDSNDNDTGEGDGCGNSNDNDNVAGGGNTNDNKDLKIDV